LAGWILLAQEHDMRATIIATAAFALLSACDNPGDCLDGASDVAQGSGDAALFVLPIALAAAGVSRGTPGNFRRRAPPGV
jgi:hypothetical protein